MFAIQCDVDLVGAVINRPLRQNATISHRVSANSKDCTARALSERPYKKIDRQLEKLKFEFAKMRKYCIDYLQKCDMIKMYKYVWKYAFRTISLLIIKMYI